MQTGADSGPEGDDPESGLPGLEMPDAGARDSPDGVVPVVGLGGSAGSIETLQRFFQKLPADGGLAYVVVVHLSSEHESLLVSILQRSTTMPVCQVNDTVLVLPDHVYVISPGKQLSMDGGKLQAVESPPHRGKHTIIDLFFRTLAESHGPEAVAVVLSGGDGDGAIGLKRIKERGGLTIAQDPTEADVSSMPLAAIATGMVDWILPADEIPGMIIKYRENGRKIQLPEEIPERRQTDPNASPGEGDETALREVLAFLRARTGHEFADYKRATVLRRIGRRMQVTSSDDLPSYLAHLRTHPGEASALLQDLLISVTNFFRDREAFEALEVLIPEILRNKTDADPVRVWVAGCATGEEAYSMAILLSEHGAKMDSPPQIQIFATDLDQAAIDVARDGRYPENIAGDVTEQRLAHFFTRESGCYRVRRSVREMVLFAKHDLLKDSPFSRLDLVSCRNLLIYLNRDAQARVFDTFHFALRPEGKLFLGSSESAEEAAALFHQLDKKHRIFTRRSVHRVGLSVPAGATTLAFSLQSGPKFIPMVPQSAALVSKPMGGPGSSAVQNVANTWSDLHYRLVERVSPPSLVIGSDHQIMHLSRNAGRFLQFAGGEPTMDLLRVIQPSLRTELRAALFRAGKSKTVVEISGVPMELDGVGKVVDIRVEPVEDMAPGCSLVMFSERDQLPTTESGDRSSAAGTLSPVDQAVVRHLEEELDQMRAGWRETVEQYEASVEELKASNEEFQAMNEELRSATEELETGREELQSINEEIITINQELKFKVEELSRTNSDLQNLMASTRIATIFLDRGLLIKRYTPDTTELFNVIPSDLGRPLSDITHRLDYPQIIRDANLVLERLAPIEREVRNDDGRWYLARMFPYRSAEDQIGGVVITYVDITERKQAEETRQWLSSIVESSNDAIVSFTLDGKIVSWNKGAGRIFGHTAKEIEGQSVSLLAPADRQAELDRVLVKLSKGESIEPHDNVGLCKDGQLVDVSVSISVIYDDSGEIVGATAIIQDIAIRKTSLEELKQARNDLESRVEERTAELRKRISQLVTMTSELTLAEQRERKRMAQVLHDQLQQVLVAVKLRIESLDCKNPEKSKAEIPRLIAIMDGAIVNSRSLVIDLSPPVLAEGLGKSLAWLCCRWMKDQYDLDVTCDIDESINTPQPDLRVLLFLAVKELLFNVVKHSKVKEAYVNLRIEDSGELCITVRDPGMGFDLDDTGQDDVKVTGLGLIGLRERLEILGGKLQIQSSPGNGVEVTIRAPLDGRNGLIRETPTVMKGNQ